MNFLKKKPNKRQLSAFSISLLIHALLFLILIFIEVRYYPVKIRGTSIQLIDVSPYLPPENSKSVKIQKKINIHKIPKKKTEKVKLQSSDKETSSVIDTASRKPAIALPKPGHPDTGNSALKYASTLLDTFLVRHPEYAKYILQQQAKNLMNNKKDKMFTRLEAENRINDELHKYIKENFPEGSEHAMNPNGGPGMQIPIDGLIEAIKKIFK